MQPDNAELGATIVPTLRYCDVGAAIDWLCNAFGFERHHVVNGDDGAVRYAELTFGTGMIMLGPIQDSAFDRLMTQPANTGGVVTQICYLFVADADTHCAQARAAGAEIILDIEDEASSGRGYSCRDLEGHIWNFGTYDPWRRSAYAARPDRPAHGLWGGTRRLALVAGLVVAIVLSAAVVRWALGIPNAYRELEPFAPAAASVEDPGRTERDQLARERDQRELVERAIKEVKEQLTRERSAKEGAEHAVADAREQLARERSALEAAQHIAEEARLRLASAERSANDVHQQLAAERSAREDAERASQQARAQLAKEHKEAQEEEAKVRAASRRARPPRPRHAMPRPPKHPSWVVWDQK
jgi:uncharacterized glyoxalase superfamily protein PhnB